MNPWEEYGQQQQRPPWEEYAPPAPAPGPVAPLQQQQRGPAADVAVQAPIGVARGTLGLAGLPADTLGVASNWLRSKTNQYLFDPILGGPTPTPQPDVSTAIGSAGLNAAAARAYPELAQQPSTTAGAFARTAGEFMPGALLAPGAKLANAIRYGIVPGVASEGAGEAAQAVGAGPTAEAIARVIGGVGGGLAGGSVLARPAAAAGVPTAETIGPMKTAAYNAASDLGAAYTPEAYSGLIAKIKADAKAADINPELTPKSSSFIQNMGKIPENEGDLAAPVSLTALDQKRKALNRDVMSANDASERHFGGIIKNNIDQFVANAGPEAMAAGSAPEAASAIQNARDLNTRYAKNETLNDALEHAGLLAAGSGSGGNIDNATRQAFRKVLEGGTWSPDEAALLKQGVEGTAGQNALRNIGKLSPRGNGLMLAAEILGGGAGGAAALMGHPIAMLGSAAVPAAGMAAKYFADKITSGRADQLRDLILAGGKAPSQVNLQSRKLGAALAGISSRTAMQPSPDQQ